jgi:hypothetical protein
MKTKMFVTIALATCLSNIAVAQEAEFKDIRLTINKPPMVISDGSLKNFDVTFTPNLSQSNLSKAMSKNDYNQMFSSLNLTLEIPNYTQKPNNSNDVDLHVLYTLKNYVRKNFTVNNNVTSVAADIKFDILVADKYGEVLYDKATDLAEYKVSIPKVWKSEKEMNDDTRFVDSTMIQLAAESVQKKINKLFSNEPNATFDGSIAYVDGMKKFPEYASMKDDTKALIKTLEKNGITAFLDEAKKYVPFWESQLHFNDTKDSLEVIKVMHHNLALYYVLIKDVQKATTYINAYELYDDSKTVRPMLGAIRYKKTEELTLLMNTIAPNSFELKTKNAPVLSMAEMLDARKFLTIKGTVYMSVKKEKINYTGRIKIAKVSTDEAPSDKAISMPDADYLVNVIVEKDGKAETIEAALSKVDSIIAEDGTKYKVNRFGNIIKGRAYMLLKQIVGAPAAKMYTIAIPLNNTDLVVERDDEDKGEIIENEDLKKQLAKYLKKCEAAVKLVETSGPRTMPYQQIAELYSTCK